MSSETSNVQENLSESWIELGRNPRLAQAEAMADPASASMSPIKTASVNNGALERLLLEAQRESSCASSSRLGSVASSVASPRGQHSPTNDQPTNEPVSDVNSLQLDEPDSHDREAEWIWDWSSRPEAVPPSFSSAQFKHPVAKRRNLSIRNTRIMTGIVFSMENLPVLIFSHACSFLLGAASVLVYLRRYYNLSSLSSVTINS